jgi:hypothetical protein
MSDRTYSYDPTKLSEKGVDRMRFELGDTTFAPGELTAALCDEEYEAMIQGNTTWKIAKVACLKAILMRFSHQVDVSIDGVSYSFSDRVDVWTKMLSDVEAASSIPQMGANEICGVTGAHYFHTNMHANGEKGR